MGNLVLGRREGQSIVIKHPLRETIYIGIVRVTGGDCTLEIVQGEACKIIKLPLLWNHDLSEEVRVCIAELAKGRVKLSFNAPLAWNIVRTEVLDRD